MKKKREDTLSCGKTIKGNVINILIQSWCGFLIIFFLFLFFRKKKRNWKLWYDNKERTKKRRQTFFLFVKKRINKTRRHKAKTPTPTPTPIPIAWLFSLFSLFNALQLNPFPSYPSLHLQLKLPCVFVQIPNSLHPPLLVKHSLISLCYFIYLIDLLVEIEMKIIELGKKKKKKKKKKYQNN